MPLNPNVLVAESDVAARIGAVLSATTYTIFGLVMQQSEFQTIINNQIGEEIALVGTATYNTADSTLQGVMKSYQISDCCYSILTGLAGRAATYFNYSVGDERFDLNLTFLQEETQMMLKERDRLFNMVQNILSSATGAGTIDSDQPGYSSPSAPVY